MQHQKKQRILWDSNKKGEVVVDSKQIWRAFKMNTK